MIPSNVFNLKIDFAYCNDVLVKTSVVISSVTNSTLH